MSIYLGACFECGSEELMVASVGDNAEPVTAWIEKMKTIREESIHDFPPFPLSLSDIESYVVCAECGGVSSVIEHYKDEYRPEHQVRMDDVIVNPKHRYMFDNLDNGLRPVDEHEDWFGLPYIVGEGDSYEVRCYDGGAWDRSTGKAFGLSLYDAIEVVKANYNKY